MIECVNGVRHQLINRYSDIIPQIETELLLAYMFKCSRTDFYTGNYLMDEGMEKEYRSLVERRLSGEPLQYIIGSSEFMGLEFIVNKDVFIPRPETEILVNEVLRYTIYDIRYTNRDSRILDLCTGCGNIAISLAQLIPGSKMVATDISAPALKVAQKNAIVHSVDKQVLFYKGDLFRALAFDKGDKFDIIVCNPPYIKAHELGFLQDEVRSEPEIALDGGVDGLGLYRRIERDAPLYLKPDGSLFLEIGFGQVQDVAHIFSSSNRFTVRKVEKDFAGIDRALWISLS